MQKQLFEPYRDIIIFMVTLFVANYAWKWSFTDDEMGEMVLWLGHDVTPIFDAVTHHVARMAYRVVSLFRDTVHFVDGYILRFDNGNSTGIVWGCSGLKQSFIWLCLILTVRGGWVQKLWYIPIGWVVCYVLNILRVSLLALMIESRPDLFDLMHDYIFKYLFYLILFGLWALFVGKIRPRA